MLCGVVRTVFHTAVQMEFPVHDIKGVWEEETCSSTDYYIRHYMETINLTPRSLYLRERTPVFIEQEAGSAPEGVCTL